MFVVVGSFAFLLLADAVVLLLLLLLLLLVHGYSYPQGFYCVLELIVVGILPGRNLAVTWYSEGHSRQA